jgi:hypothetical protein
LYAIVSILNPIWESEFWSAFNDALQPRRTYATTPTFHLSSGAQAAQSVAQLLQLVLFGVGVVFLIWFFRAATNARSLGLPARHTPVWAVFGFLIPIVNLWFPYQVACDLFPPGHEGRRLVGRWWALYLGASFTTLPVAIAAFASLTAGLVGGVVIAVLWAYAAIAGREMIRASLAVHAEMMGYAPEASPR